MIAGVDEKCVIKVDVLEAYFLKLLQRDGAITNNKYLAAVKKLKEEEDVNSNKIF